MVQTSSYTSKNLFLGAVVALSVYVPFETVAKVSLIAAAILFVVDPISPYSRLIALVSCWVVLRLNKFYQDSIIKQQYEEEQASMLVIDGDGSETEDEETKKDK